MSREGATRVAVIGGMRTPFAKAGTAFRKYSALELSVHSVNGRLDKQSLDPASVDELVYGIVVVDPRVPHMAREVVLSTRRCCTTRRRAGSSSTRPRPRPWAGGSACSPGCARGISKPTSPGIEEPSTGLSMGEHTELMVKEWKILSSPSCS